MKCGRGLRTVFGVLALALFVGYFGLRYSVSPKSDDFDSEHAFIYSDVKKVIDSGGDLDEFFRSDPRYAYLYEGQPDAAGTQTQPDGAEQPVPEAPPEPTPEPDPNSPEAKAAALGLPAPPDIDTSSWEFMLVNGDNSIGQYEPEQLAYLNQTASETDIQYSYNANRCAVDARIAQPLLDMALGCKDAGLPVYLSSGYRSYSDQQANFTRVCNNNGVSDGKDANGYYITMPAGCSEHQAALCCDITDVYHEIKNASLDQTDTYKWLYEHCTEYGFILRFPNGKGDITGVMYEPFHFRYVGLEAAAYIMENDLTLEEFLGLYSGAPTEAPVPDAEA